MLLEAAWRMDHGQDIWPGCGTNGLQCAGVRYRLVVAAVADANFRSIDCKQRHLAFGRLDCRKRSAHSARILSILDFSVSCWADKPPDLAESHVSVPTAGLGYQPLGQ